LDRSPRSGPSFCPSCRKSTRPTGQSDLCERCGDRLVSKGYCPVCEDFVSRAVGEPCPKHQVVLEPEAPPTLSRRLAEEGTSWVEVGRFSDALACQPPRIRLEAEGIPTMIDGERMGDRSMYHVATGGVVLRVPENLAGDARIILSQTWSADAAALGIDDWADDEDHVDAPELDMSAFTPEEGRSTFANLAVLAVILTIAIAILFFLEWLSKPTM
jgi:hypothetical protein